MKNKKAFVMSDAMVWLILGLLALVILSYIFYPKIFKGGEEAGGKFSLAADCDNDGVENIIDKCPCASGIREAENSGCPAGSAAVDFTGSEQRNKCYKENKCP